MPGRQRKSVWEWADGCRHRYREVVIKETCSAEKVYVLEFGTRKFRRPGPTEPLTLVVNGMGQNPLMLLTNRRVTCSLEAPEKWGKPRVFPQLTPSALENKLRRLEGAPCSPKSGPYSSSPLGAVASDGGDPRTDGVVKWP